jgi:hypothetical protein
MFHTCIQVIIMKKPPMDLLHTLFIDHAYVFRSPSATILRVNIIKEYNKKSCVTNPSKIWIYKMRKWLKCCI